MISFWISAVVILYFAMVGYLGYRGYRSTHNVADYMIGGRKVHPYVMAMSYGATFISTSAIVGFGGAAGVFGLGLLWLTVLNIFVGIFVAFIAFGGRTRLMGLRLDAHTFPELLGRRFRSRLIQGVAGLLIFSFMPLYAAAVLMGAAKFLGEQLGLSYEMALFVFSAIIALYVVMGGIKGVMYTDALQGTIMLLGMAALLVLTYQRLGGVVTAHAKLTAMAEMVPAGLARGGHVGWTAMPRFGSPLWWTLVSTIVMGVGIGVLAQPQLAVRYMTVKSGRELNRAVPIGGVFILMMTGVAFIVGALCNVYFNETSGLVAIVAAGGDVEKIIPMYIKAAMPGWFGMLFMLALLAAAMSTLSSQFHVMGTSLGRDLYEQFLTSGRRVGGVIATRTAILIGIILSVYLGYELEQKFGAAGVEIVARGTAVFFGMCACAFLPMFVGGLWSRGITKVGAVAGMLMGAVASIFWMLFVHEKLASAFGLSEKIFGVRSLGIRMVDGVESMITAGPVIWAYVDPLIIGLPLAILATVICSCCTRKFSEDHLAMCFGVVKSG